MLVNWQGKTLSAKQKWWREKRLPEIEGKAYDLIRRHESRCGKLSACVVHPEILPTVGSPYPAGRQYCKMASGFRKS